MAAEASGKPLTPRTQKGSAIFGAEATEEMQGYLSLPPAPLGEWPKDQQPFLDEWCGLIHRQYPNPTLHRDEDGKPVVISSGTLNGKKVMVVVDDFSGDEDARFRFFGFA